MEYGYTDKVYKASIIIKKVIEDLSNVEIMALEEILKLNLPKDDGPDIGVREPVVK